MKFLPRSLGSMLYLAAIAAVALCLVLVATGLWRVGVAGIGATFLFVAVARIAVPAAHEGMLRVRGKSIDVLMVGVLGGALVALAISVPPYR